MIDNKFTIGRRALLAAVPALAASACATLPGRRRARPLGLADITVRKELAEDWPRTLAAIAAIGYSHFGFSLARMSPREEAQPSPTEKAAMVRAAGLGIETVRLGFAAPFEPQIEAAALMGARNLAYTAAPIFFRGEEFGKTTRAAFDAWLPEFGALAEQVRSAGLNLLYHNHAWDHVPLDGETPIEILARTFSPSEVGFEIDLAWTHLGGQDPLSLVRELGARVASMHYKDIDPERAEDTIGTLVPPGEGVLDYANLTRQVEALTDAIGYVEVDAPDDGLAAARTGFETIMAARTATA